MTTQTIETEREKLEKRVRYILAVNRIPRNGTHQAYEQGKQIIQQRQWDSGGDYYRAIAILARWVGV